MKFNNKTVKSNSRMIHFNQVTAMDRNVIKCPLCSEHHFLWRCTKFMKASVKERLTIASNARLCFNCLRSKSHIAKDCTSQGRCKVDGCKRRHNSLLHYTSRPASPTQDTETHDTGNHTAPVTTITSTATLQNSRKARLKVVPVEVTSTNLKSKVIHTYAFLDDGSNATLCTNRLMKKLGIQGEKEQMQISTIFGEKTQAVFKVDLKVKGINESIEFKMTDVYALPSLPDVSGDIVKVDEMKDILVGVDNIQCLLIKETKVGREDQPLGIHTGLGWALAGNVGTSKGGKAGINFTSIGNQMIYTQLEQMFSLDFCAEKPAIDTELSMSVEDACALRKMEDSVKKFENRYEVSLPWKRDRPFLPNNRDMAVKRLNCLRHKFLKDPELFNNYANKIDEYLQLGYTTKVTENINDVPF